MGQQLISPYRPLLRFSRDGAVLAESVVVAIPDLAHFVIPEGYTFDGHSVPWFFRRLFPKFGPDVYAALVHDYAYEYNLTLGISRKDADEVYRVLMNDPMYKMSIMRSWTMPLAVRLFGGPTFRDDAK